MSNVPRTPYQGWFPNSMNEPQVPLCEQRAEWARDNSGHIRAGRPALEIDESRTRSILDSLRLQPNLGEVPRQLPGTVPWAACLLCDLLYLPSSLPTSLFPLTNTPDPCCCRDSNHTRRIGFSVRRGQADMQAMRKVQPRMRRLQARVRDHPPRPDQLDRAPHAQGCRRRRPQAGTAVA